MAKALLGHVGVGNDVRLIAELRRLQRRVRDLEDELARMQSVPEVLPEAVVLDDALHTADLPQELREPALA
jgi:hypothetical protein